MIALGMVLAFVFLNWGEGAFSNVAGDRIAILVLSQKNPGSIFGSGYGLYTTQGIPGVVLGLAVPLCLFAGAGYVALGMEKRA
jgi:hypothetical protein